MITAIEIVNFKGIGERVRVELKPLTLLFGANSSGKSTIIQALHLAREIFERHNLDPDRTVLGGDAVDLGGFRNFVHNHDVGKPLLFRIDLDLSDHGLPEYDYGDVGDWNVWNNERLLAMNAMLGRCSSAWVEIAVAWLDTLGPLVLHYDVGLNGQRVAGISVAEGAEVQLDYLDFAHPVLSAGKIMEHVQLDGTEHILAQERRWPSFEESFRSAIRAESFRSPIGEDFWGRKQSLRIPFGGRIHGGWSTPLPEWQEPIKIDAFRSGFDQLSAAVHLTLSRIVVGPGDLVRNELRRFRYLGPLRDMPPRNYDPPRLSDVSRWAKGLAAWDTLYRADDPETEVPSETPRIEPTAAETAGEGWQDGSARAEDQERDELSIAQVNRWLTRLRAGYTVRRTSRTEVDTQAIPEASGNPNELRRFIELLRKQAIRTQVRLVPDGQSIEVQPHDVGTGISQLLPVVVLALDARKSLVAIEQPELHLHPKLQTELGDLFVESALASGNRILIETHSEHLMLRLLRRIEETHSGELPSGRWPLRPDQVSVVFVEQIDGAVRTTPLRIDETGEFIDRWPRGFFEERADELF